MTTEPFADRNLPFYDAPTVTLFREQLARFREDYGQLIDFAAFVLKVDPKTMCNADFGAWLLRQDQETITRAPAWVRESAVVLATMAEAASDEGEK